MSPFEKALQKVQRQQMTHEDRGPGDRRVRDALKTMGDLAYDTTSLPFQMLTYSPEAEGAFIGPKGIERLKKAGLGDKMKEFTSRFFGDRAEINPSDAANVWWRMGNPLQKMDEMLKSDKSSTLLQDIIHPEEFPELFTAYPQLKNMKVDLKPSQYEKALKASYNPPNESDIYDRVNKIYKRLHRDKSVSKDLSDRVHEHVTKKPMPGSMSIAVPEQMNSQYPSQDIIESLLHESQHYIQNADTPRYYDSLTKAYKGEDELLESNLLETIDNLNDYNRQRWGEGNEYEPGPGSAIQSRIEKTDELKPNFNQERFMDWLEDNSSNPRVSYVTKRSGLTRDSVENGDWEDEDFVNILADLREDGINTNDFLKRVEGLTYNVDPAYLYKMNPYEREAFEASKRDIDPQYRNVYKRKTEE